eukprot:SAG31_NODE_8103_length_1522_cov_16.846100_2_plen_73_part_00
MPPSSLLNSGGLAKPSKEQAKLHRTATRAAWVPDPGAATERTIFDPDAISGNLRPRLYREFSTFLIGTANTP